MKISLLNDTYSVNLVTLTSPAVDQAFVCGGRAESQKAHTKNRNSTVHNRGAPILYK
jgi:hypothetical protein